MNYYTLLLDMLREIGTVDVETADGFSLVLPAGGSSVRAHVAVTESTLAAYADTNFADGLAALGFVKDDATGRAAAIGLLAVHLEETVATSSHAGEVHIEVTPRGLSITRC